jgi:hypothetical protein
LYVGDEKLYIRGVTYGPFEPEPGGSEYHAPEVVEGDFSRMREEGVNVVRTYTVPPRWLLDLAREYGIYLMLGLPCDRPLLLAEVGLDSRRNGLEQQARTLDWQIRTIFAAGAVGTIVFLDRRMVSRGTRNHGLGFRTHHSRSFAQTCLYDWRRNFSGRAAAPNETGHTDLVVICSYNGGETVEETFAHVTQLNYPAYETIVGNGGSTDSTSEIAGRISTLRRY